MTRDKQKCAECGKYEALIELVVDAFDRDDRVIRTVKKGVCQRCAGKLMDALVKGLEREA